jgi:hypothetical protein
LPDYPARLAFRGQQHQDPNNDERNRKNKADYRQHHQADYEQKDGNHDKYKANRSARKAFLFALISIHDGLLYFSFLWTQIRSNAHRSCCEDNKTAFFQVNTSFAV